MLKKIMMYAVFIGMCNPAYAARETTIESTGESYIVYKIVPRTKSNGERGDVVTSSILKPHMVMEIPHALGDSIDILIGKADGTTILPRTGIGFRSRIVLHGNEYTMHNTLCNVMMAAVNNN